MTYSPSLYVYARRFVESPEVREDIVCDVFARLWLKGEAFILKEETALAFLKTSVRNACLNHIRSCSSADNFLAHQMNVPSYADSPEAIYTLDEMYALLYETCYPDSDTQNGHGWWERDTRIDGKHVKEHLSDWLQTL